MKEELVIRECQDLETHLNRTRGFTGSLFSMSGMISSGSSGVGASISDCRVVVNFVKKLIIRVRLRKAKQSKWARSGREQCGWALLYLYPLFPLFLYRWAVACLLF